MSVAITLPPSLQALAAGQKNVAVPGRSVGDCLDALTKQYPQLREKLYGRKGELIKGLNIFINGENAFPGELARPVADGDKIFIAYTVLGG